jgi:hypothetical protein
MADAGPSERERAHAPAQLSVADAWRLLNAEQRAAAVGAVLLIVSTFGPFSFVEAAIVITGVGVLVLLRKRAEGREFHIPFGDGTVIAAAGVWSALLILVRLFDRPFGQGLLALVCAAILVLAGGRERAKRPMDDLPGATRDRDRDWLAASAPAASPSEPRRPRPPSRPDWSAGQRPPPRYSPRAAKPTPGEAPDRLWREPGGDDAGVAPADPPEWTPDSPEPPGERTAGGLHRTAGPAPPPAPPPPPPDGEETRQLFDERDPQTPAPEHPTGAPEPDAPPRRPQERPG